MDVNYKYLKSNIKNNINEHGIIEAWHYIDKVYN